jgi:hypothetical protein
MLSQKIAARPLAAIAGAFAVVMAATAAEAAILAAPAGGYSTSEAQLAAGNVCGPGAQMGANGVCHPDSWFTRRYYCPPGTHLGPNGRRCWPN